MKRQLLFAASALHQRAESNLRGRHRLIRICFWFFAALFVAGLTQQQAFAGVGCTDENDLTGTNCSASKLCGETCDPNHFIAGDLSRRLPIQQRTLPVTVAGQTTPPSSARISIIGLSLLLLTVPLATVRSIRRFEPHLVLNGKRGRS